MRRRWFNGFAQKSGEQSLAELLKQLASEGSAIGDEVVVEAETKGEREDEKSKSKTVRSTDAGE